MPRTRDTRITGYEPLLSPAALLDETAARLTRPPAPYERTRAEVRAVLDGSDDPPAGPRPGRASVQRPRPPRFDYAGRLAALRDEHRADLLIVMRVYFEKPRTVTG